MFKRKLIALEHPCPEGVDINSEIEFRNVVLWLEDQKIRHYKIEDRQPIRQVASPDWPAAFTQYQKDLDCPIVSGVPAEQLEWLLGYAVKLEYADNTEKYRPKDTSTMEINADQLNTPKVITANPLDNLDFNCEEFKDGVNTLAQLLSVTRHPDPQITLKAISKVITQRLNPEALAKPDSVIVKGTPFPFQEADLGFDTGDYVLNQAAKILRLLYIHDMRDLQTRINECIVAVQTVTADPKTDTKLGKVGMGGK